MATLYGFPLRRQTCHTRVRQRRRAPWRHGIVNKREEDDMADAEWPVFEPHGFASTPIWGGVKKPKITLKFKDGVTVGHKLDGNEDRTVFDALDLVPKEWQMHGIKNVRVK